ncbi:hypothetical protein [Staphylococcus pseudintermedius]|uniref:hypothetical protein n=1 Tax=Staphylococcus pseudintermedius TaxID=283734 RepID=UPI001F2104E3|nr:hypothetical protein [Staphylococcus pseudintermedius]
MDHLEMIYVQEMTMTVFTIISIENILTPSMFKYARWIGLKISFNRITMYEDAESSPHHQYTETERHNNEMAIFQYGVITFYDSDWMQ